MNETARASVAMTAGLSLLLGALHFALHSSAGVNFGDEGFYDYGVLRVLAGEVPVFDFQAYDGLRYYWGAAFASLLGDDLWVVRLAASAFAAMGIAAGLRVFARLGNSMAFGLLLGVLLAVWMQPWYRSFDTAAGLFSLWAGVRLLEAPSTRNTLLAGAVFGVICWIGRNHALYAALAFSAIGLFATRGLSFSERRHSLAVAFAGFVIGSFPVWLPLLMVSGYAESVLLPTFQRLASTGSTNLAKPIPVPWEEVRLGTLFMIVPLGYAFAALWVLRMQDSARRAVMLAAVCVGIPYLHHAFSRADMTHLAVAIPAALLLAFAAAASRSLPTRIVVSLLLLGATYATALMRAPGFELLEREHETREVRGFSLPVRPDEAAELDALSALTARMGSKQALFAAPSLPGVYGTQGLVAPGWDLYMLWPRPEHEQEKLVARLDEIPVDWLLLNDRPVDGRADLCLANLSPLLWHYLVRHFAPAPDVAMPTTELRVYRRIEAGDPARFVWPDRGAIAPEDEDPRCSRLTTASR